MKNLVREICSYIRREVQSGAVDSQGNLAELRSIFHGPSGRLLEEVFEALTTDQLLEVTTSSGERKNFPVLLQVEGLKPGEENPKIGRSGRCDENHLLTLRNSPDSPQYLALVPPGQHRTLSVSSAISNFGVRPENNSGSVTIDDWWSDDFIQQLAKKGLARGAGRFVNDPDHALPLLRAAVEAADEVDRHDVHRTKAWNILERTFAIPEASPSFGLLLSLTCGFPPAPDGQIHSSEQIQCLRHIADIFVDTGFKPGVEAIKARASLDGSSLEAKALDGCLAHLSTCDLPTSFERATPYYYSPISALSGSNAFPVPEWWSYLTIDKWSELLQEDTTPAGSLAIECANSLTPNRRGMPAIVASEVELTINLPDGAADDLEIIVARETGGDQEWQLRGSGSIVDSALAVHRTPIRYSANAVDFRKATARVVSLAKWKPGLYAYSRTASKVSPPKAVKTKREKVSFEASLVLSGRGRHYVDLFVGPDVIVSNASLGSDGAPLDDAPEISVSRVSEHAFGFEVDVSADCHCDVEFQHDEETHILRVWLESSDVGTEGVGSEFERLIKLNRAGSGVGPVQANRQARSSQLQAWALDAQNVKQSYRPIVLSADYAENWRCPNWATLEGAILSHARFLHDPRPSIVEMEAPPAFIEARASLAAIIRGKDESGLVESAALGDWLANDETFSQRIHSYIDEYTKWLETEPTVAPWCDTILVVPVDADGKTLNQDPEAVILSPLHPVRLAWQALAQKTLFQAIRLNSPSPAASILDPGRVPDIAVLPLRTPTGQIKKAPFLAVECSSDYWSVLWNGERLGDRLGRVAGAPFDKDFGLEVGGVAGGFSGSQIERALDDVTTILGAKPVVSVAISGSSPGQVSACDAGLLEWCRDQFSLNADRDDSEGEKSSALRFGPRLLQVFDYRRPSARPDDAALANIAEDTGNSVRWFGDTVVKKRPDLGIIAQLDIASPSLEPSELRSPLGPGGLIRHRIRHQLNSGASAFLTESRMGEVGPPCGDGVADKLASAIVRLENLDTNRSYTFAPSVHAIQEMLEEKHAGFVAVSSSSVDPACFLGEWLKDAYLWDYNLPSYSKRAGDTDGYYLLSSIKEVDRDTLKRVMSRLPGDAEASADEIDQVVLEVARRGIPTVRGLSSGDAGAGGDLGLFLAARLLQDEFRTNGYMGGLLPSVAETDGVQEIVLIVPVDPFWAHIGDLQRSINWDSSLRADLLVLGLRISESSVACKLTPVEVKYRNGSTLSVSQSKDALGQAAALSAVFGAILSKASSSDLLLWQLTAQHLFVSIASYGFRVYSQRMTAGERARNWTRCHQRVTAAILSGEVNLEVDAGGRLIVMDASSHSSIKDYDEDGAVDALILSPTDAATLLRGDTGELYSSLRSKLGQWRFMPAVAQDAPRTAAVSLDPARNGHAAVVTKVDIEEVLITPNKLPETEAKNLLAPKPIPKDEPNGGNGIEVLLGATVDSLTKREQWLNLSDTALNQLNIGVVGDLGTGKTQFLKSLICQIGRSTESNEGVTPRILIFDYKKDYSAAEFVNATGARVVEPFHLPINIFDISGSTDRTAWLGRYKFFSDVLDKIYPGIGPVQRAALKQAVRATYDIAKQNGLQPTIYDVHEEYKKQVGTKVDSVFSILDDIVDGEIFTKDPIAAGTIDRFLDGVVVIQLDALGQDDRTKNMVVAIMLNVFYEHMLKIPKRPYRGTAPQLRTVDSFLLVDEADSIMRYEFDVLRKILLQGREFGVGVILASQYLRHFKAGATDYREPLLTWFVHKVPNVTAQELGALGLTSDVGQLAERVKTLPNHHCLFKTVGAPGDVIQGLPFYQLMDRLDPGK